MTTAIRDALSKLDADNDNHWTADGLPRLETVKLLAGDQALNRDAVTAAAPGFSRANMAALDASSTQGADTAQQDEADDAGADTDLGADDGSEEGSAGDTDTQAEPGAERKAVVKAAQDAYELARTRKTEADRALAEAQATLDRLVEEDAAATPRHAGQLTIQAYLKSQAEGRMQRAQNARAAMSLQERTKAPIDKAFARRNARGTKRPTAL